MKCIILITIFISSTSLTYAQWFIGIKAGPTLSNYKTKTPWKEASNLGYVFGASAYKQMDEHMGIAFELQYIQKGYYHKICNSITDKLKASYLEVPIMFDYGFRIPASKNFKGHANVGLYAAYWLSGKYQTKGFDASDERFDFKKGKASRFDVGPNVGGRIEYLLKSGSVTLDFRYEIGLIDLQKKAGDDTKNTNRAMVIGISYFKPIGH